MDKQMEAEFCCHGTVPVASHPHVLWSMKI